MRMRLARNYNFNTHVDASHSRDVGSVPLTMDESLTAGSELLAKVVRRRSSSISSVLVSEEDDYLLDQAWSDANSPGVREEGVGEEAPNLEKENTVKSVQCSLIMLMGCNPGTLEITTKHVYFSSDNQEKKDSQSCECVCVGVCECVCVGVCVSVCVDVLFVFKCVGREHGFSTHIRAHTYMCKCTPTHTHPHM